MLSYVQHSPLAWPLATWLQCGMCLVVPGLLYVVNGPALLSATAAGPWPRYTREVSTHVLLVAQAMVGGASLPLWFDVACALATVLALALPLLARLPVGATACCGALACAISLVTLQSKGLDDGTCV